MDDREKLVELVCEVIQTETCNRHCNHPHCDMASDIADQLLSHGVTIREPGMWHHIATRRDENGALHEVYACSRCRATTGEKVKWCHECGAPMRGESK